ncbi:hypothetical protein AAFF_G00136060 [Aldrovandia affinis]|uniref:Uncharacterized protein n=1 Tax=Aldrovandia affinis TaxID=143900 RepID=A0AAD7RQ82_9TELE|nr:hypothetical protein AAFF_G00136060 [Aldrovandia affinis]
MGCQPVSSRLITIRLRATPFNITIIQASPQHPLTRIVSKTNDRGLRLLEFARYNNLMLANTLGLHKASRRWTWHSPNGEHHNQIDYILIKKRPIKR